MDTLGLPQYLLESSFCLLVFYAFYYWVLRRETFFQINRIYLIVTPLLSIVIPLFNIDLEAPVAAQASRGAMEEFIIPVISNAEYFNSELAAQIEQTSPIFSLSFGEALMLLYFLGMLLMSGKLLFGLLRLFRMIRKSKQSKEGDYTLIDAEGKLPAASFFSFIFWNGDRNDEKQRWILEHELVHLRQWHSLDVLTMELIVIVKWFNPLIYFFRESLKVTHEYIADNYVAAYAGSIPSYAKVLINQSNLTNSNKLVNTFSALIKKRLIMLGKDQSRAWHKLKYLLSLPILGLLMLLFSFNLVEQLPSKIKTPLTNVSNYLEDLGEQELIVLDLSEEKERSWLDWGGQEIYLTSTTKLDEEALVFMSIKRSVFDQIKYKEPAVNIAGNIEPFKNIEFRIIPQDSDYFIKVESENKRLTNLHEALSKVKSDFNLFFKMELENGESLFGAIVISEDGLLSINSPKDPFYLPMQEKSEFLTEESGEAEERLAEDFSDYHFEWGDINLDIRPVGLQSNDRFISFPSQQSQLNPKRRFGKTKIDLPTLQNALSKACKLRNKSGELIAMDSLSFQLRKQSNHKMQEFTAAFMNGVWSSKHAKPDFFKGIEVGDFLMIRMLKSSEELVFDLVFEIEASNTTTIEFPSTATDYIKWGKIELPAHVVNEADKSAKFVVESVDATDFVAAKHQALSVYRNGIKHPVEKVYISVQNENDAPLFCDGGTDCFNQLIPKIKSESSIQLLIRTKSQKVFYTVFSISSSAQSSVYRYNPQVNEFINKGIQALSYRVVSSIETPKATFQEEPHLLEWGSIRLPFHLNPNANIHGEKIVDYDDMIKSIRKEINIWINDSLVSEGRLMIVRFPSMEEFLPSQKQNLDVVDIDLSRQGESQDAKVNLLLDRIKKGDHLRINADLKELKLKLNLKVFNPDAAWRPSINREALLLDRSIYRFQFIHKDGYRTRIKMDTTDKTYRWMYDQYKDGKQLDIVHIPNFQTVKRIINDTDEVVPKENIDVVYHLDKSFVDKEIELYPEFYDFQDRAIYLNWRGATARLDNTRASLADFQSSTERSLELLIGEEKFEIIHFNMTVVPLKGEKSKIISHTINHELIDQTVTELQPKTSIYFDKMLLKQADGSLVHFPIALVYNLE